MRIDRIPAGGTALILLLAAIVGLLAGILWVLLPAAQYSRYDPGGSVVAYANRADAYTGPLPDYCASACTLYLLHGCVTPETELIFHLPSVDHTYWRETMARHYPPAIAQWFLALPSGDGAWTMSGRNAIDAGARRCG